MQAVEECASWEICHYFTPFDPEIGNGGIVRMATNNYCETLEICTTYFYEVGGGFPPGGGGTPPSGGGGWSDDPCKAICGANPCGGQGGGWVPIGTNNGNDGPCSSIERALGGQATLQWTLLSATAAQFAPFDQSGNQQEQYFLINKVNGTPQIGSIQTLPTGGGRMQGVTSNTIMYVHTHPCCGSPFFSPKDFFGLAQFNADFQIAYVVGYNGTKYAMMVNNYSQLQAYVNANPNSIGSDGEFIPNTSIFTHLQDVAISLANHGYSLEEAYERALAFLMKEAGVTLLKAPVNSNTFKKIGIMEKKNPDGTTVIENNLPVYENADCL